MSARQYLVDAGRVERACGFTTVRSGFVRIRGVGHAGGINRVTQLCFPVAGVTGPRGTLGMDIRPARIRVAQMRRAVRTGSKQKYQGNPGTFFGPVLFLVSFCVRVSCRSVGFPYGNPSVPLRPISQSGLVFPNPVLSFPIGFKFAAPMAGCHGELSQLAKYHTEC